MYRASQRTRDSKRDIIKGEKEGEMMRLIHHCLLLAQDNSDDEHSRIHMLERKFNDQAGCAHYLFICLFVCLLTPGAGPRSRPTKPPRGVAS